jgi:hypothetical protein
MPKSILENMNLAKGKSKLKIYYDKFSSQLVLRSDEDLTKKAEV